MPRMRPLNNPQPFSSCAALCGAGAVPYTMPPLLDAVRARGASLRLCCRLAYSLRASRHSLIFVREKSNINW